MRGFSHESQHNETIEWYTPPGIFNRLRLEFTLDPASPGADKVPWIPAKKHFTIHDDGLKQSWENERVWLNPPYNQQTAAWVEKFMQEYCTGIMLVFARTDTKWFHDFAINADALCFVKGRIKFYRGDGYQGQGSGAASLLLARGRDCVEALKNSDLGWTVDQREDYSADE